MMGRQEADSEDALIESQDPVDQTNMMMRGFISVVVWGVALAGCVIAIAMFTSMFWVGVGNSAFDQ